MLELYMFKSNSLFLSCESAFFYALVWLSHEKTLVWGEENDMVWLEIPLLVTTNTAVNVWRSS